jgi:Na+/proline symporter
LDVYPQRRESSWDGYVRYESSFILGGAAVTTSIVKFISVEYATTLVAAIIGSYTIIGGLGATFYVSYFNTAIIYIVMIVFISKVYMDPDSNDNKAIGKYLSKPIFMTFHEVMKFH